MSHPWQLTDTEAKAITSLIEYGASKKAASKMGVSMEAFHDTIRRARKRSGVKNTILLLLEWDRLTR